jgi:hypothetical protein
MLAIRFGKKLTALSNLNRLSLLDQAIYGNNVWQFEKGDIGT